MKSKMNINEELKQELFDGSPDGVGNKIDELLPGDPINFSDKEFGFTWNGKRWEKVGKWYITGPWDDPLNPYWIVGSWDDKFILSLRIQYKYEALIILRSLGVI